MTDQKIDQRANISELEDEDPLAELARIVSGGVPKYQRADKSEPDLAPDLPDPDVPDPNSSAPSSSSATAALHEIDAEMDMEAELMRELGADSQGADVETGVNDEQQFEDPLTAGPDGLKSHEHADTQSFASNRSDADETSIDLETLDAQLRADLEMADRATHDALSRDIEEASAAGMHYENNEFDAAPEVPVAATPFAKSGRASVTEDFFQEDMTAGAESGNASTSWGAESAVDDYSSSPDQLQAELVSDADFGDAFAATVKEIAARRPAFASEKNASADLEADFAEAFADELGTDGSFEAGISKNGDLNVNRADLAPGDDPGSLVGDDVDISVQTRTSVGGRGRGFKLALAALTIALMAGAGVIGWGLFTGEDGTFKQAVVIEADPEPVKVKPTDPGGKKIANTGNKVYESVSGQTMNEVAQENLISSRQQPVDIAKNNSRLETGEESPSATALNGIAPKRVQTLTIRQDGSIIRTPEPVAVTAEKATDAVETVTIGSNAENAATSNAGDVAIGDVAAGDVVAADQGTIAADQGTIADSFRNPTMDNSQTADAPGASPVAAGAPEIAQPESLPALPASRPVVKPVEEVAAIALAEPAAQPETVPRPVVKPVEEVTAIAVAEPAAQPETVPAPTAPVVGRATVVRNEPKPKAVDPNAPTQIAALPPATRAPVASDTDWTVQVSSQRSEDAAQSSYGNLKRRFSSLLSDRSVSVQKADVEGKGTFYRVRIPASSKSDAISLCESMKSAGGSCFVTR